MVNTAKPDFDQFITIIKEHFPDAQITDGEINNLRKPFSKASLSDLRSAYAVARGSMQPLSVIYRQLLTRKPSFDELFNQEDRIKGRRYNYAGKTVEHGTDWDKKAQEAPKPKVTQKELEGLHQWFVNFDLAIGLINSDERYQYKKLDDKSDTFFKELYRQYGNSKTSQNNKPHFSEEENKKYDKQFFYPLTGTHIWDYEKEVATS